MTPLRHFVFFCGIFRSLYVIKVPFYLGGRFPFVSGFTRDFPISLPRLQAGLAGGREEHRWIGEWQLAPHGEGVDRSPVVGWAHLHLWEQSDLLPWWRVGQDSSGFFTSVGPVLVTRRVTLM